MALFWAVPSCGQTAQPEPAEIVAAPEVQMSPIQHYKIDDVADFSGAMAAYTSAVIDGASGLLIHIAPGVYERPLQLGSLIDTKLNVRIEGAEEVWFQGASLSVSGADVEVSGIGFRGVSPPGNLLTIYTASDVQLSAIGFDGVKLGHPGARQNPTTIPSHLIFVSARGEGAIRLYDIEVKDVAAGPPALLGFETRPLREIEISRLHVVNAQAFNLIQTGPSGGLLLRDVRAQVPEGGVFLRRALDTQKTTIRGSRIIVDDPDHFVIGQPPTLSDTVIWGRINLGPGWRAATANGPEVDGF